MTLDERTQLAWAHAAGALALPAFGVGLVLLLAGAALLERTWRQPRARRLRSALPPSVLLAVALGAGFAVVLGAGALFAELAEGVLEGDRLAALDHAFTSGVQAGTPAWAVRGFALLTHLGDTATLLLLGAVVALALWRSGRGWLALAWMASTAGGGLLNWSLKQVFERTRPGHADGPVQAEGYSFPSGHSCGSLVVFGLLAYLALRLAPPRWHRLAVLVAAALALTVAASRVFLRVHYASDVLAGLAVGAAWLGVCVGALETVRRRRRRRAPPVDAEAQLP